MPIGIVNLFKVINIQQEYGKISRIMLSQGKFPTDIVVEETAITYIRQSICGTHFLELLIDVLKLNGAFTNAFFEGFRRAFLNIQCFGLGLSRRPLVLQSFFLRFTRIPLLIKRFGLRTTCEFFVFQSAYLCLVTFSFFLIQPIRQSKRQQNNFHCRSDLKSILGKKVTGHDIKFIQCENDATK